MERRVIAALLAIFAGTFGIHKFYLGKVGQGLLYLIFFWTGIPTVLGWIEGFNYLSTSDENFERKYGDGSSRR
jgi:TM2 domain-containing membrane protein YozV